MYLCQIAAVSSSQITVKISVCIILSKGPSMRAILKAMLLITRDCGREMFFYQEDKSIITLSNRDVEYQAQEKTQGINQTVNSVNAHLLKIKSSLSLSLSTLKNLQLCIINEKFFLYHRGGSNNQYHSLYFQYFGKRKCIYLLI